MTLCHSFLSANTLAYKLPPRTARLRETSASAAGVISPTARWGNSWFI